MSKRMLSTLTLCAVMIAALAATGVMSKEGDKAAAKQTAAAEVKSWYLVVSPHTKAECLQALDQIAANGEAALASYDWGCMDGDHTGYTKVQAASAQEALSTVPEAQRSKAKVIKLNKFTLEQVKSFHEAH